MIKFCAIPLVSKCETNTMQHVALYLFHTLKPKELAFDAQCMRILFNNYILRLQTVILFTFFIRLNLFLKHGTKKALHTVRIVRIAFKWSNPKAQPQRCMRSVPYVHIIIFHYFYIFWPLFQHLISELLLGFEMQVGSY